METLPLINSEQVIQKIAVIDILLIPSLNPSLIYCLNVGQVFILIVTFKSHKNVFDGSFLQDFGGFVPERLRQFYHYYFTRYSLSK